MIFSDRRTIWIGYEPRERDGFKVARASLLRHLTQPIAVHDLVLGALQERGLYTRPIEHHHGAAGITQMWDVISGAPMSTQHANARFLVPHLAKKGWAAFADGDVLFRADAIGLFGALDPAKAVYCVQHHHAPDSPLKMDGQIQTVYRRKNWSSVMVFNCDHPANGALTPELVNALPGRDLHRFCWLDDDEIGALSPEWNWVPGHSSPSLDPRLVHFTDGLPDMPGYEAVAYADEWRSELARVKRQGVAA